MRLFRYSRLLLFVLLPLVFSCRQPSLSKDTAGAARPEQRRIGTRGGKLVYRVSSPPKTFNYLLANDEPSILTAFFLLNGRLVEFDHSTQTYVPGLAEAWTMGSDHRSVDVRLRDGLKFSDGQPRTSSDVPFTRSLPSPPNSRTSPPISRSQRPSWGCSLRPTATTSTSQWTRAA